MTAGQSPGEARREIIYKDEDLTVVAFDRQTDAVFATFNEMGLTAQGDRYWGSGLFESMGISAVGFVSARPNWYPPSSMLPAIACAKARFPGKRIISYGFSQGGYGALKFGEALGAGLSLAFSPQWSIAPDDVGTADPRFTAYYDPARRNGEKIAPHDLGARSFVFFDRRMRQDKFNADRLIALDTVHAIPVPFAGHDTVRLVSEGGIAKSMIRLCMERLDIETHDIRALLRQARRRSPTYAQAKVVQLIASARRHPTFLRAALASLPDGPIRAVGFIRSYLATGEYGQAAETLETLQDAAILQFDLLSLWAAFRSAHFRPGEARLAPLFAKKYGSDVFARLHAVNAHIELGQTGEALAELDALSSINGALNHAGHFIDFYQRLGKADAAARIARAFSDHEGVAKADRVRIGAGLLQLYKKYAMRGPMFTEILAQTKEAAGDPARLLPLIELAFEIKSLSLMEHIIQDNPALRQTFPVVGVYAAQCEVARDSATGTKLLRALFANSFKSYQFWWQLSIAAEQVLPINMTIDAALKALRFAEGPDVLKSHNRLAHLYTYATQRKPALSHLKTISSLVPRPIAMFGTLAKLALRNGNAEMAAELAKSCLAAEPSDISVVLQCCSVLISTGRGAQAEPHVCRLADAAELGKRLTQQQFDDLLLCCQSIDYRLEQRMAVVGANLYSHGARLKHHISRERSSFAAKFFVSP